MAAESLEKKAKEIGCKIKVETRGSGGAKNVLTESEIDRAEAVIVAADTKVPMSRFNGKKVIEVQVSDGISKADKLINRALMVMHLYTRVMVEVKRAVLLKVQVQTV